MDYVIAGATKEFNNLAIKKAKDLLELKEQEGLSDDTVKLLNMVIRVLEERNKKLDEINKPNIRFNN